MKSRDTLPIQTLPDPDIILETDRFLAICKPGGLLTQAPPGIDSMEIRIKQYLAVQNSISGKVYLGVPHRLDRPASGVMVFAKNRKAARFLSDQFQQREVTKTYWALVSGRVEPAAGKWTDWMRKIPDEAKSELCRENEQGAQSAVLNYKTVRATDTETLLQIDLETGRSHQIRLQASTRGHSILGDALYGSGIAFGPQTEDLRGRWIALHARELTVIDPGAKQPVTLVAELPDCWPDE